MPGKAWADGGETLAGLKQLDACLLALVRLSGMGWRDALALPLSRLVSLLKTVQSLRSAS